jgi:hypothetical protein
MGYPCFVATSHRKEKRDNMYHMLRKSVTMHLVWLSVYTVITSLNSVNQLIFVTVKCSVLFEVLTEFLNNV